MITVEGTIPFPPGTDAQALKAFGTSCTTLAKALGAASAKVTTATNAASSAWSGAASTSFASHMNNRNSAIQANGKTIAKVEAIMTAYATAMTAAEAEYNVAVAAQQAAIAGLPWTAAAEAAAITAQGTIVVAFEATGMACAGALALVVATLGVEELAAFDPGLVAQVEQAVGNVVTGGAQAVGPVVAAVSPTTATATAVAPAGSTALVNPTTAPKTVGGAFDLVNQAYAQPKGTIAVVKASDGHWLVALPGIEGLAPSDNPLNLFDAGAQIATGNSAYEDGVRQALIAAGAQPGDSVMFVAHSQGGLTAVDLANNPTFTSQFHVTNILTAGSPIGDVTVPAGTNILSVENTDDLVPHLNNTSNSTTHPTVQFTDEEGSVSGNHAMDSVYTPEANSAAFQANSQVQSFTQSASPYLNPTGGTTTPTLQYFNLSSASTITPALATSAAPSLPPIQVQPPVVNVSPALVGAVAN